MRRKKRIVMIKRFSKSGRVYTIILAAKKEIFMILEFKKSGRVYIKEKEKEKGKSIDK